MLNYIKLIFSFRHHHLSETGQLIYEAAVLELLIVSILSIKLQKEFILLAISTLSMLVCGWIPTPRS